MKNKHKSKRAAAKRFIKSKTGLLKRKHAYRSHLANGKTTKQKRHSRKDTFLKASDAQRFTHCL